MKCRCEATENPISAGAGIFTAVDCRPALGPAQLGSIRFDITFGSIDVRSAIGLNPALILFGACGLVGVFRTNV